MLFKLSPYRAMKILVVFTCFASYAASAQSPSQTYEGSFDGAYVGINLGKTFFDDSGDGVSSGIFGGWRDTLDNGLVLGFEGFMILSVDDEPDDLVEVLFPFDAFGGIQAKLGTVSESGVMYYAGAGLVNIDRASRENETSASTGGVVELGLEYKMSESIGLRLSALRTFINDGGDSNSLYASVYYHF